MSIKHWKIKLTAVLALLATIGSFGAYALARSHGGGDCHQQNAAEGHHGWGQHRMGGPGHQMKAFVKELNLSPEQQTQFEQIKSEMKKEWQAQKGLPKQMRQQLKETLKTAFLREKFEPGPLRQQLQNLRAKAAPPTDKMAQNMVKAWSLLTPEQRAQVEAKLDKIGGRVKGMMAMPFTGQMMAKGFPPLRHLMGAVDLTEAQKEQLQVLFNGQLPQMKAKVAQALQFKAQVLAELKQPQPDPARIGVLLKNVHGEFMGGLDSHLEVMAQVHDLLTLEQRQALVEKMAQHHRHHE